MSGWSQRSVAIIAPRRAPVDSMVAHMASQMCMKDTGPEAMLPVACGHHAGRAQGGEIVAHAAAMLHGERALLQRLENVLEVIGDLAHDEAVEQRDPVPGAGAGENAPAGQEAEPLLQAGRSARPTASRSLRSAAAIACATRRQVSAMPVSPSARYLVCQTWREISMVRGSGVVMVRRPGGGFQNALAILANA